MTRLVAERIGASTRMITRSRIVNDTVDYLSLLRDIYILCIKTKPGAENDKK